MIGTLIQFGCLSVITGGCLCGICAQDMEEIKTQATFFWGGVHKSWTKFIVCVE